MEYDCQILLANKVQAGFNKVARPLCTSCVNKGCTNPIVDTKISVFGKIMSSRMYQAGGTYFMVIQCDGYQSPEIEIEEEDQD